MDSSSLLDQPLSHNIKNERIIKSKKNNKSKSKPSIQKIISSLSPSSRVLAEINTNITDSSKLDVKKKRNSSFLSDSYPPSIKSSKIFSEEIFETRIEQHLDKLRKEKGNQNKAFVSCSSDKENVNKILKSIHSQKNKSKSQSTPSLGIKRRNLSSLPRPSSFDNIMVTLKSLTPNSSQHNKFKNSQNEQEERTGKENSLPNLINPSINDKNALGTKTILLETQNYLDFCEQMELIVEDVNDLQKYLSVLQNSIIQFAQSNHNSTKFFKNFIKVPSIDTPQDSDHDSYQQQDPKIYDLSKLLFSLRMFLRQPSSPSQSRGVKSLTNLSVTLKMYTIFQLTKTVVNTPQKKNNSNDESNPKSFNFSSSPLRDSLKPNDNNNNNNNDTSSFERFQMSQVVSQNTSPDREIPYKSQQKSSESEDEIIQAKNQKRVSLDEYSNFDTFLERRSRSILVTHFDVFYNQTKNSSFSSSSSSSSKCTTSGGKYSKTNMCFKDCEKKDQSLFKKIITKKHSCETSSSSMKWSQRRTSNLRPEEIEVEEEEEEVENTHSTKTKTKAYSHSFSELELPTFQSTQRGYQSSHKQLSPPKRHHSQTALPLEVKSISKKEIISKTSIKSTLPTLIELIVMRSKLQYEKENWRHYLFLKSLAFETDSLLSLYSVESF